MREWPGARRGSRAGNGTDSEDRYLLCRSALVSGNVRLPCPRGLCVFVVTSLLAENQGRFGQVLWGGVSPRYCFHSSRVRFLVRREQASLIKSSSLRGSRVTMMPERSLTMLAVRIKRGMDRSGQSQEITAC